MKITRANILLSLSTGLLLFSSCKQDKIFGDTVPNTERPIVEFSDPYGFKSIAMDYSSNEIVLDITDLRFMIRTDAQRNATAKIRIDPTVVSEYNGQNGTSYTPVPITKVALVSDTFSLSPTERSKRVSVRIKPSDVATGENAIGIAIVESNGAEVSRIAGKLVISVSVKNKYDGVYHLKGFYTRTDNPAINGPFEADVEMITTGINSVAMYYSDAGGFAQPFVNAGSPAFFTNVAPEVFFNATDQASSINNYTGDPAAGPFMTLVAGANSRYVGGTTPVIYLKYYYNTIPTNRIFADTLIYTGSR
jgi:hypothetical protein